MIRPLRPRDVLAVRRGQGGKELTAATWPKTPPESREPGVWDLLRYGLQPSARERPVGVSTAGGRVDGWVLGRSRAGGLVWDVEYLRANSAEDGAQLLRWVCDQGLAALARRLFIETPPDGTGAEVAGRASFERYTEGGLWQLDPGFAREEGDSLPARPRLRSDEVGLFQLYNAAVPATVRGAEAMTSEEWGALYRGRKLWAPRIIGDRQDFVWELGARPAGWMRTIYGQRAQFLELLIHPQYESYADRMVKNALVQMSNKAPVIADVREYQGTVQASLQRAGFRPGDSYAVWVRQLAPRVAEPASKTVRAPVRPSA